MVHSHSHSRSASRDLKLGRLDHRRGGSTTLTTWPATVPEITTPEKEGPQADFDYAEFGDPDDSLYSREKMYGVKIAPGLMADDTYMTEKAKPAPPPPVTWMSLPRKDQLFILFIGRLVDFLQVASLQTYVPHQLRHMNPDLTDAQIASQTGWLVGAFTGAQVMTAILWGKAADAPWCGRKWVLIIGLGGTAISCLGYSFVTTLWWAMFWRIFAGAINGTVGIIRTMVAEFTKEKRYQSRAFLILPMSFNVANALGPLIGGKLVQPYLTFPGWFDEGAIFDYQLFRDYPFALPSLINCFFLTLSTILTYLFLEETLLSRKHAYDSGLHLQAVIKQKFFGGPGYVRTPEWALDSAQPKKVNEKVHPHSNASMRKLPFSRVWTRNVIFTLITGALFDFQLGAFTSMWGLFLSSSRYVTPTQFVEERADAALQRRSLPMLFTGGLGMPASTVGSAMSLLGWIGIPLQVVFYPPVQSRLGTMRSYQWFLLLFPIAYFVAPYLSIVPSATPAPEAASGAYIWMGIFYVLLLQVTARTFTLPASIILLNNSSPHPSVLGTIHGLGQSVSAGFRTVGPIVGGWWYGYGLDVGMVAWGWWSVAAMASIGCLTSYGMHDGSGHEIFLEGELDERLD